MDLVRIVAVLMVICLSEVWSLTCYSCFSYVSHTDCESRYHLKEIECHSNHDTCVKFNMLVTIDERHGDKNIKKVNKAYARSCGTKTECQGISICKSLYRNDDAMVSNCVVECCDPDLKAKCNARPGWSGNKRSSSIITHNNTRGHNQVVYKGERGTGAQLAPTILSLVIVCLLGLI